MTGGEAVVEQLDQIDLAAGGRQGQEVHIVNVDVAVAVRFRMLGLHHEHHVEFLGAFGTVAEHCRHGSIAVDIGIFALDIGIDGSFVGNFIVDAHQTSVHLTDAAALGAVEDIGLGSANKAVLDQHALYGILNILNVGRSDGFVAFDFAHNLVRQFFSDLLRLGAVACAECAQNGFGNLIGVEGNFASVPFDDGIQHERFLRINSDNSITKHII